MLQQEEAAKKAPAGKAAAAAALAAVTRAEAAKKEAEAKAKAAAEKAAAEKAAADAKVVILAGIRQCVCVCMVLGNGKRYIGNPRSEYFQVESAN